MKKSVSDNKFSHFRSRAILIFLLAACFYLYEYVLQVSLNVMTDDLMRDFNITAAGLGFMAAFYFYSYTAFQIPAGLLFDKFGPRRIITVAILAVSAGAYFFSLTGSVELASIGRLLMGVGSAFSFIGILVLLTYWFEAKYFALLVGTAQMVSSVGAFIGGAPLAMVVEKIGWRHSILYLACAGGLLAGLMWLIIRDRPNNIIKKEQKNKDSEWAKLRIILSNPQSWYVALYAFMVWAPIAVFAEVWGTPYFVALYGMSTVDASFYISLIWLGVGIGCPFFGWFSDRIKSRCLPLQICSLLGLFGTMMTMLFDVPLAVNVVCLVLIGMAAAGQTVSFAIVKENNKLEHVGTASGFNNMATVAGGAIFHPIVGILLSVFWVGTMKDGIPIYQIHTYEKSLLIIPVCYLCALFLSRFVIKETHCQQQVFSK